MGEKMGMAEMEVNGKMVVDLEVCIEYQYMIKVPNVPID